MATLTFEYAAFDSGRCRVEFDVNDANWRISRIRCINGTDYPAQGTVLEGDVVRFQEIAPANATTVWQVPGMQIGWDPVDGGLVLGNWSLRAQWPSR